MKCPECQQENPSQSNFCLNCGVRLAARCGACGSDLPFGSRFCNRCGSPVGVQPTRFASPDAYTPRHLAERILTSKTALEGERKQVTVLFADLKGSMELLAGSDPEDARQLLDPVLEHMMEAVHHYEGTVNQVMGDGIMALFGAPLAHEDHPVRACYAALRMQDAIRRYAEQVHRTRGIPLQIRIGLNSGQVVVRSVGSDLRMDYTAVGQTTHLAARMEQMAMPGSVLLTEETLNLAEGYVVVKPLGPRPVKGLPAPVEVYELTGAATVRSRLHVVAARGLTRFVGRDRELEGLQEALERARGGHGQVVAVVGEPGVGKSRLYWEFAHSHRTHDWLILESGSVSYGKATAYLPVIDLLKAYFQIEGEDDARKIREKVTGKLLLLDRVLEPSLPPLLSLLDVPVDDPQWERLDPAQHRQRTLEGAKRLLLRESQVQPLLVMFEDLHWIDAESQAFLDSLVESLPTARLLLLVNYRPEYQHGWGSKTYYQQLRIDPLPAAGAEALLEALLGSDGSLSPLKRLLVQRAEGNPFFLEESVRALVEARILEGERGRYRLVRPAEEVGQMLHIPATAQAILAARMDRLAPEDKRLLQAASVIGKDVPYALLQAIAQEAQDTLRAGLSRLQAAEFVYEARLFPDLEYTFKHSLTHEVAYGSLLQDRRRRLHVQITEAMERLYPDRLGELAERLAHHAVRGDLWAKAVSYLRQAGAKAFARSANREAVNCFEQALAALRRLPESRETLEQAIDLRFDLRTARWPLGDVRGIAEDLGDAERLARALGDQRRLGWASMYMAHYLNMTSGAGASREAAERAQRIAETLDDFELRASANFYLGWAFLGSGDYREAERLLRIVTQLLEGERSRERCGLTGFPAVMARWLLAWCLTDRGEFAEALLHAEHAVRLAETLDHPYSLILAHWSPAYLFGVRGDFDEAARRYERALEIVRDWNIAFLTPYTMVLLGSVYARSGRVQEGLGLVDDGLKTLETMGLVVFYSLCRVLHAEACLGAGRREDALVSAERAVTLARERGERGHEAWALTVLGDIASHPDCPNALQGEESYRHAIELGAELGMRPVIARCHFGLGKLHRRAGKRGDAGEHLDAATRSFREMDMRFWLDQAEAEARALT